MESSAEYSPRDRRSGSSGEYSLCFRSVLSLTAVLNCLLLCRVITIVDVMGEQHSPAHPQKTSRALEVNVKKFSHNFSNLSNKPKQDIYTLRTKFKVRRTRPA